MQLVLIRHAEAVPLGISGIQTDEERPLTETGKAQCWPLATSLRRLGVRIDLMLTSPLVRARQTADGICQSWGDTPPRVLVCPQLAPGGRKRELLEQTLLYHEDCLALVGHNPDLSELVGWLIGSKRAGIDLDKAGLALVEFDGLPAKGKGTLVWLVTPTWSACAVG